MHAGARYLTAIGKAINHATLSAPEADMLKLALNDEAQDCFQSSMVSFVDALRSIQSGFFSWAAVKLYYSVFYALRSRLALADDCIYYVGRSPRVIAARAGGNTVNLQGTTHKAVLDRFSRQQPRDYFLSQPIEGCSPLDWFTERREQTNYTASRFCEPDTPNYFEFARSTTTRKMLCAYTADDVYVFDEQHAMVAFPFKLLRDLRDRLRSQGLSPLVTSEVDFLRGSLRDHSGPISVAEVLLI